MNTGQRKVLIEELDSQEHDDDEMDEEELIQKEKEKKLNEQDPLYILWLQLDNLCSLMAELKEVTIYSLLSTLAKLMTSSCCSGTKYTGHYL